MKCITFLDKVYHLYMFTVCAHIHSYPSAYIVMVVVTERTRGFLALLALAARDDRWGTQRKRETGKERRMVADQSRLSD